MIRGKCKLVGILLELKLDVLWIWEQGHGAQEEDGGLIGPVQHLLPGQLWASSSLSFCPC